MLIAITKYLKPLSEIDAYREEHLDYLKTQFVAGKLLIAGRQNPAVGGVIISKITSRDEFKKMLENDPFTKAGLTEYAITEFNPVLCDSLLNGLVTP